MDLSTARRRLTALALGLAIVAGGAGAGMAASQHGSSATIAVDGSSGATVLATWGWGDGKTALPSEAVVAEV